LTITIRTFYHLGENFFMRVRRCSFVLLTCAFVIASISIITLSASGQSPFKRKIPEPVSAVVAAEDGGQKSKPWKSGQRPATLGTCDTTGPVEVESTGGLTLPTAYATLAAALSNIVGGTHTGSISIEICGNTTETVTATLTASGAGATS